MEEQLEMIEEIEELSVEEPEKNESEIVEPPKEKVKQEEPKAEEIKTEDNIDTKEVKPKSNKGKNILTIILAILLFIDLAALVIYLIGIEKVLSFVK